MENRKAMQSLQIWSLHLVKAGVLMVDGRLQNRWTMWRKTLTDAHPSVFFPPTLEFGTAYPNPGGSQLDNAGD